MKHAIKLKNGLRVHLVPFSGTQAATVMVLTKVGSRYENEKVLGGSHFIEHLMFKGTKKHPTTLDITKILDRYGARFNAFTGQNMTGYYVKINGDQVPVAVDLLFDMLYNSKFEAKEINRERGVILEELKMYKENPIMNLDDLLMEAVFNGNPLARGIAGTAKSIKTMKRADLIKYRDQYYVPSETVVVIAGKVPKNAKSLLQKTFGQRRKVKQPPSFQPYSDQPEREVPRIKRQYKKLEQIQIAFGFPAPGKNHSDKAATRLLANILGGNMSSRLFVEVREKRGLAYGVYASYDAFEDVGLFYIRAGLDRARLALASKTIFKELNKIKRQGVTAQELRYAKDNLAGHLKLSLENSKNRAHYYGAKELFYGEVETVEEKIKRFQVVKTSDIKRVAKDVLNLNKMSIAAIGPYKTDAALLKHLPVVK